MTTDANNAKANGFALLTVERLGAADGRLEELERLHAEAKNERKTKKDALDSTQESTSETIHETRDRLKSGESLTDAELATFDAAIVELDKASAAFELADREEKSAAKKANDLRKRILSIVREYREGPALPGLDGAAPDELVPAWMIDLADLIGQERADAANLRELKIATVHDFHEAIRSGVAKRLVEETRLGFDTFGELFDLAKAHAKERGLDWTARRFAEPETKAEKADAIRPKPADPGDASIAELFEAGAAPARQRGAKGRPKKSVQWGLGPIAEEAFNSRAHAADADPAFFEPIEETTELGHEELKLASDGAGVEMRLDVLSLLHNLATTESPAAHDAAVYALEGGFGGLPRAAVRMLLDDLAETVRSTGDAFAYEALSEAAVADPRLAGLLATESPKLAAVFRLKPSERAGVATPRPGGKPDLKLATG
jgi:hypothetical protein